MAVLSRHREQRARGTPWRASKGFRTRLGHLVLHLALIGVGITFLLPFVWLVSTSLKVSGTEFSNPPQWIPNPILWSNYKAALVDEVPFAHYFQNTLIIAVCATVAAPTPAPGGTAFSEPGGG